MGAEKTMQKMAQGWFSQGGGSGSEVTEKPSSSLLSDWNTYAASQAASEDSSSLSLGFDLESAVRSANDTVSGTFNV